MYLVHCYRSYFEVLLADQNFNRAFMGQVILEKILTLSALEETWTNVS